MLCAYAQQSNGRDRITCGADEKAPHQLCPHQKYCHQNCEWENSPAMLSCERRIRMNEMNSNFDIEVASKKENKEKQIQYKKYEKNKDNKEGVESVKQDESVKQELKDNTENEVNQKPALKEGWARGVVTNKWSTSAWVVLENGCGLTMDNFGAYSIGETVEFELPSWYRNSRK